LTLNCRINCLFARRRRHLLSIRVDHGPIRRLQLEAADATGSPRLWSDPATKPSSETDM